MGGNKMKIDKYLFFIDKHLVKLFVLTFISTVTILAFTHSSNIYPYLLFSFVLLTLIVAIALVEKKFKKRGEVNE